MLEYISPKWIPALYKKLLAIRGERKDELTKLGDVFGNVLDLAKFYIEPNCSHINPADIDEDEPVSYVATKISSTINQFLTGEFAVKDDGRNQLFILSDAGMGKTSFLMMMKLGYLTSFWPTKDKCVLTKINSDTVSFINSIEDKGNTILLLDALDEDPTAWGNYKGRVLELLKSSVKFRRVIITCRTQFFPNEEIDPFKRVGRIKISQFVCPMIYLSLFNDRQVDEYLVKRFRNSPDLLGRARTIIDNMGSLRFRPLLLAHIDGFLDSTATSWSEYNILKILIDTWLMREESKLYEQGRAISHMLLLEACVTVAALMQKKRSREICEKDLLAAIEIYPVLNDLQYIEFGGRSLLNRTCEGDYRFSHYAIQEFIMAYGLIENLIANRLRPLPYSENLLSFILNGSDKTFKLLSIDFSNVEYQGAKFEGIDFSSVSFSGATLFHTTFKNCTLAGCNFSRSVFSGSIDNTCYENLDFSGCDFTESSLALTHFKNCNFKNCRFANAKLEGGAFINCNFDYSDFTSSSLTASNMSYSSFRQCTFVKANVLGLKVDKSLMQSDYSKADNADKICIMVRY